MTTTLTPSPTRSAHPRATGKNRPKRNKGSDGVRNDGFLYCKFPFRIEGTNMTLYSSSVLVPSASWTSYDGNPCGMVKTGSGKAGIGGGSDFTGFKYVEVRAGKWAYGVNGLEGSKRLPPGQVFRSHCWKKTKN